MHLHLQNGNLSRSSVRATNGGDCLQTERGSMSDSGCKESSLPVCTYTFGCLLAGQTVFHSHPRRRLLFAAVFRLPVGSTQTLFPACTEVSVPCGTVAGALV